MKWLLNLLFRPCEESAPELDLEQMVIVATPWAGRVHELQELGLTGAALTRAVQQIETAMAETERRIKAELNLSAAKRVDTSTRMSTKVSIPISTRKRPAARRAKWRELKRNQRARLQLVTKEAS